MTKVLTGGCEVRSERVDALLPDDAAFAAEYARLPAWRRGRSGAFRFPADKRRSVAAWVLLRNIMAERGEDADGLEVVENEAGKPAFASRPDVQFNLSHAGERVMVAVASVPVGCDVEQVSPLREGVAEACLTPGELVRLAAEPEGPSRDRAFCAMWVRKESYVKARGSGLSTNLKSFSVLQGEEPLGAEFEDFDFGDGHLGCVCRLPGD